MITKLAYLNLFATTLFCLTACDGQIGKAPSNTSDSSDSSVWQPAGAIGDGSIDKIYVLNSRTGMLCQRVYLPGEAPIIDCSLPNQKPR